MTPIFRMDHAGEAWVFWAEFVFVMVFTVEFAIKVIADGFILPLMLILDHLGI